MKWIHLVLDHTKILASFCGQYIIHLPWEYQIQVLHSGQFWWKHGSMLVHYAGYHGSLYTTKICCDLHALCNNKF